MALPVANFLVENVFCILDDPTNDSRRIDARKFGIWVRDLPTLMAPSQPKTHTHSHVLPPTVSVSTSHPLALKLALALYHPSVHPYLTRNTFMDAVLDHDCHDGLVVSALDLVPEDGENGERQQRSRPHVGHHEPDVVRSSGGAPIQTSGSPAPGSHELDIEPIFQAPYDLVCVGGSESLVSVSQTLSREVSSPTPPTITTRTSQRNLASGKGSDVATRITRSDSRNSSSHSGSARPTSVPNMITELGSSPRRPKQRRQLSNYLRTSKDKFSVPRPVTNPDDDTDVRNDSGDDNCEDEFFDVDSGSYNGPRSTKTVSS